MTDTLHGLQAHQTTPVLPGASAEEQLRGLIALSTEAIVTADQHQRIVLFNQGAEEIFGYAAADVLGQPLSMLLPRDVSRMHERIVSGTMREGTVSRRMGERRSVRGRRRNGEEFEALVSISTIQHESGSLATAIVRDISDIRKAEEALRQSEFRFRTLVEASPAGIFSARLDGRVVEANPAFIRMMGLPSDHDFRGLEFSWFFVQPGDWPRIIAVLQANGRYPATEHRLRSANGATEVSLLIKAVRVPASDDSAACVHVFALDVTARRLLEETVRRTEQLDLIGRLAGGVAHDFNNLLLVIRMGISLLAEEEGLSEQGRSDLQDLRQATVRAGELTQQLLAFGRRQVMRPTALDLNGLVSRQADLLRRLLGEDVVLRLHLGTVAAHVMADEAQLERVLANLATNARDAMRAAGLVEIRVEVREPHDTDRLHCADLGRGEWVHLSFSDSGAGLDAETRVRIFDPFFTTKEVGRGTGLGLASVYGIVTQSGGQIGVESQPGEGATFHIWFPRVEPAAGPSTPAEGITTAPTEIRFSLPVTVLLIEDEPAVRSKVDRVLSERGITVLSAGDARTALLKLSAHEGRVDAVVADIVLPGLSGPHIVDWIVDRYPHIKVLFISGYSPETAHHRGEMRAGSVFLQKPFAAEDVLRELAKLLAAE